MISSSGTEPNKDNTFVVQSHPEPKPAFHNNTDKISSDEESAVGQSELGLQHLSVSKLAKENGEHRIEFWLFLSVELYKLTTHLI